MKSEKARTSGLSRFFWNTHSGWLKPGGVLVMIVPFDRVNDCRGVLTPQFRDKTIHRLTEPEAAAYKQVAGSCVRRSRQEREKLTDFAVQQGNHKLRDLTRLDEETGNAGLARPNVPVPMRAPAKLETEAFPSTLWKPAGLIARLVAGATSDARA